MLADPKHQDYPEGWRHLDDLLRGKEAAPPAGTPQESRGAGRTKCHAVDPTAKPEPRAGRQCQTICFLFPTLAFCAGKCGSLCLGNNLHQRPEFGVAEFPELQDDPDISRASFV